jgi:hypothetical protein
MPDEPAFAGELLTALDRLGEDLLAQAHDWEIQTNETARGVLWLVPAALLQIEAAHLVELGASAGLNLLADHRGFTLRWPDGPSHQARSGRALAIRDRLRGSELQAWAQVWSRRRRSSAASAPMRG